jgi:FG-GAP repeat protein
MGPSPGIPVRALEEFLVRRSSHDASLLVHEPRKGSTGAVCKDLIIMILAGSVGRSASGQQLLWEATGPPNSHFGTDVDALGDVNGDGAPDLVAGGYLGFSFSGVVRILSGTTGAQVLQVIGPTSYALGYTVAGLGDVTGDAVPDFLAGSAGPGARLYSGATGALVYEWLLGYTWVAGVGDQNGDGVPDALVGGGGFSGAASLFSGADGSPLISLYGSSAYGLFGAGVAGIGDLDGDGDQEFVVGAPVHGAFSSLPGHAYVYAGGSGTVLDDLSSASPSFDDFGRRPTGLGDITGDGIPDFGVRGSVGITVGYYLYSGADRSLLQVITDVPPENETWTMAGAGDVDGDGVPDAVVGSPGSGPITLPARLPTGLATIRSGSDWSVLAAMVPTSTDGLGSGWSVAAIGDVDGDEFPEVAVGAPGMAPIPPVSKVRLYSGAPLGIAVSGSGCGASAAGIPRIAATRSPKVGNTFTINLSRTVPSTPALLLLGLSNAAWWGTPLPFDLAPFGLPGCSLLVSPDFAFGVTTSAFGPGNGRAVFPIAIPNASALAGAQFYGQWYVADSPPAVVPGSMTRAISCTIQP